MASRVRVGGSVMIKLVTDIRYDEYRYLYPPRPGDKQAIPLTRVAQREQTGAWAQVKKNGTSNILYIGPDRLVRSMNRHHATHKQWQPITETHRAFDDLPGTGWYVFCAELLHSKVADPKLKNVNYIHDILVADGEYLAGTTFEARQALLADLFLNAVEPLDGVGYRVIDPYTWLAVNYRPNIQKPRFAKLFQSLSKPEDEGLVFKMPQAILQYCVTPTANDAWQFKTRRPHKNYGH